MWAFLLLAGIGLFFYVQFKKLNTKTVHRHKKKLPPAQAPIAETPTRPDPRYASTNRRGSLKKEDTYHSSEANKSNNKSAKPEVVFTLSIETPATTYKSRIEEILRLSSLAEFDRARELVPSLITLIRGELVSYEAKQEIMENLRFFSTIDPLYINMINMVKDVVAEHPGLPQTFFTSKQQRLPPDLMRFILSYAEVLNDIYRLKHGRTYKLYLPGVIIEPDKSSPGIANN